MATVTIVLDHTDVEAIKECLSENISQYTPEELLKILLTLKHEDE